VFAKGLAKSPGDRYDRCIDFANALAHRIGSTTPSSEVTMLAHPVAQAPTTATPGSSGARHAKQAPPRPNRKKLLVAILAIVVLIVVAVAVFVVFERSRSHPAAAAKPAAPSSSVAPPAAAPALPVVAIGATCATLGSAGITATGAPAYCAHLPTTDSTIWSSYPGEVSSPTLTAGPDDETYAPQTEGPVLVCMEQTGQSRLDCHRDVLNGNAATPSP
jgi:serine/threonine protein kinase, bacterial